MDQQTNASQSAETDDGAESPHMTMAEELGPTGLPVHPPAGDDSPAQDANLILDTFFGEGKAEPKSGEGQAQEPSSPESQSKESLAPPKAALAATEGEDGSQPGASPTQQTEKEAGKDGGDGAAQTPGQGSQPSPEPKSSPQPELSIEDRLTLASARGLKEQNELLLERLRALEAGKKPEQQPGGQGQQQPGATDQPGAEPEPLRLVVPDQLYDAVMSDDPSVSKQAMGVLISAVASNAVSATLARVPALIDQKMEAFTAAIANKEEVSKMEKQYFERFPAHDNALFLPLIQQTVDEKFKAFPHAKWDEVMMDAVGSTVVAKLTALGIDPTGLAKLPTKDGQKEPEKKEEPAPRRQPAPMLDASTRGAAPDNSGDFIAGTFG